MLKDPKFKSRGDFMVRFLNDTGDGACEKLETGVFQIPHFNFDHLIEKPKDLEDNFESNYPEFEDEDLHSYGVCDSPNQFLRKFRKVLDEDARAFCVSFTHIQKNPENAGQGGGWRWHKWGPYVGKGKPTTEYLDDEKEFERGVYVFHILQIGGKVLKRDYKTGKMEQKENDNE